MLFGYWRKLPLNSKETATTHLSIHPRRASALTWLAKSTVIRWGTCLSLSHRSSSAKTDTARPRQSYKRRSGDCECCCHKQKKKKSASMKWQRPDTFLLSAKANTRPYLCAHDFLPRKKKKKRSSSRDMRDAFAYMDTAPSSVHTSEAGSHICVWLLTSASHFLTTML